MDVVIAMGHFCDKHGPCVILCTEVVEHLPEERLLSKIPVCSACESIEFDTVYDCEDENKHYITTRTSLDCNVSQKLKDAVLRSLSIEMVVQEGKTSGTMYFGDNNRGHIIAHAFSIKDSFARGFNRKYCIVVLGQHQISLLSHYNFVDKNLHQISIDLQEKAEKVHNAERSSTNVEKVFRSLPQLVNEKNIFAQLHMWFVFLLRSEIYQLVPHNIPTCPVDCSLIEKLRNVTVEMPSSVYDIISYCMLTGIQLKETNLEILKYFRQLLPKGFQLPKTGLICSISKVKEKWDVDFKGTLPPVLPTLHVSIKAALQNKDLNNPALQYHVMSLVLHWFSVSCVVSWSSGPCENLLRTLEVKKCDMPLLTYWISQSSECGEFCKTDYFQPEIMVDT